MEYRNLQGGLRHKYLLKKFGKNVKIERIKKELTQERLAEKMNVSQNYVASIERGKANMSLVKVMELAQALGVGMDKILSFEEE